MSTTPPRRKVAPLLTAVALALLAGAAVAQDADKDRPRQSDNPSAAAAAKKDFGGVVAPQARMAGLFDAGGAPIRTKGVQSIQRIDVGVYCIRPQAATNINVNNSILVASTEYFFSELDEIKAEWASMQHGCGPGRFGVYTLADPNRDGIYSFSSNVGFTVYVP